MKKKMRNAECGMRNEESLGARASSPTRSGTVPSVARGLSPSSLANPASSLTHNLQSSIFNLQFCIPHWAAFGLLLASLLGCFYEELSWSPDGRYLAFAAGDRGTLWRYDSQTRQADKLEFRDSDGWQGDLNIKDPVKACRYFSNSVILFLTEADKDHLELYLADMARKECRRIARMTGPGFDVAADGRIFYIGDDPDLAGVTSLLEYSGGLAGSTRTLLTEAEDTPFLRVDPAGRRLAFCNEQGLQLLDLATLTFKPLLPTSEGKYFWPTWLSGDALLLLEKTGENQGTLLELTLDPKTTRTLARDVSLMHPPSLSPDRQTAAMIVRRTGTDEPWTDQAATIDLASGTITWLTDETFGAAAPVFSPDGRALAFLQSVPTEGDDNRILKVLDMATRRAEIVWRNDEERLFAAAETLAQAGQPAQALAMLQDLLRLHPRTQFRLAAQTRMLLLHLEPASLDLDKAWELWQEVMQKIESHEMPERIARLFWRAADRVATDPAADWITTYYTPEASKAFYNANTDVARDLGALWVRAGREKIYVRIDIADKDRIDPSGVALLDTLILFGDAETSGTGVTPLGPGAAWGHAARRQVLIRHWAVTGAESQYDMEIRNEKGEMIHRFLASGFAPPRNPLFDRVAMIPDGRSMGAVYAISREALNLAGKHRVGIQVLTQKGGIDPRGATERPVSEGCGVADAFGTGNAPEKIKERQRSNEPCRIEDFAAVVEIE